MATFYPKYYYQDSVGMANVTIAMPRYYGRTIDFAVQNVAVADVVNMLSVPAGSIVLTAGYRTVATVTSASATFVIGDGTLGASYCASAVAVAALAVGARPAIAATNTNVLYAAKDHIQIKTVATANLTVGQVEVFAVMMYPQPLNYVNVDGVTKTYTYVDRNAWVSVAPVIP